MADDELHETEFEWEKGTGDKRVGWALGLAFVAALLGATFATVSTLDFVAHLDRQVHSIHCSFIPGAGAEVGESGCRTVMLSPYSSFFRTSMWGGIPISLWALATFAFLAYRAGLLIWRGATKRDTLFLLAGFGLPVLMTLIYGWLSMVKVGATCRVCVGMYVASFVGLGAAFFAHRLAAADPDDGDSREKLWAGWFAQGCGYVAGLTALYLAFVPVPAAGKQTSCGTLVQADDPNGVMLRVAAPTGGKPAVEVLDPLCPSCRAFEERLDASGFEKKLDRRVVLFPLDSTCNWMLTEPLHPGACAVSEAVLCNGPLKKGANEADMAKGARAVITWAFANQEKLRADAMKDEKAFRAQLEAQFPEVRGCLGGNLVKNKLTKSLRWGVANAIPVLTPQLFVDKTRVCDEDTDLGLEYTLAKLLAGGKSGGGK